MNLRGVVVCVNYADLLSRSIKRWHEGLDRLVVVTSKKDVATQELCHNNNIETHVTDVFYENGAKFNKGAALSEAINCNGFREYADWILVFDADIVPPEDWRVAINKMEFEQDKLYGTYRYWVKEDGPLTVDKTHKMPQGWVLGFFTMFHNCNPVVTNPVFDIWWPHAGAYDTEFTNKFPKNKQVLLDIPMIHLGEERCNWVGRGDKEGMKQLLASRKAPGDWKHERMANPPKIK